MPKKLNAAFWKWFGDSVVRNEDGTPKVVYHGTYHRFKKFNIPLCGIGCHFGTKEQAMARKTGEGLSYFPYHQEFIVVPCYLSIQHLIRMQDFGDWTILELHENLIKAFGPRTKLPIDDPSKGEYPFTENDNIRGFIAIRRWLARLGYDGIVYSNKFESYNPKHRPVEYAPPDSYVAFYPWQIKSIDNDGTWDADDPNIGSNPDDEPTPENDRLISELGDDASDPWGAGTLHRFVWLDAASRKGAIQEANRLIASGLELHREGPESLGGINYLHVGGDEWVKILRDDYDLDGWFAELAIEDLPDGFVLYSNDPFIMDKGEYNAYSAMIVSNVHDRIPPDCVKLVGVHDTEKYVAEHYPDYEGEEADDA